MTLDDCITLITGIFSLVIFLICVGGSFMIRTPKPEDDDWKTVPESWIGPELDQLK